jgi:hypothetical protein
MMRTVLAAFAIVTLGSQPLQAQAWTLAPGSAFVKASVGTAATSERYDHRGDVVPYDQRLEGVSGAVFTDRSVYLYGEYGVAEGITAVASLPLKRIVVLEPADASPAERESTDLGTALLGARISLSNVLATPERWALSANLGIRLPLGYRRDVAPAVGSGQVDAELLVSAGRSLWPAPGYLQAGAGYRFRSGIFGLSRRVACGERAPAGQTCPNPTEEIDYSDELLGRLEAGYTVAGRLGLQLLADGVWSVRTPQPVDTGVGIVQPEGFAEQRYLRLGGGLSISLFGDTALGLQAFTASFARNALRATEVFLGLETRW